MRYSQKLLRWERRGFWFIFLLGALWHYAFDWTGNSLVGLIAPVNNSVWEHTKMGVFPTVLYALLAYPALGKGRPGYWMVRAAEVILIPALMIAIFYGYTWILGDNHLAMDIALFAIAVAVGQYVSYQWLKHRSRTRGVVAGLLIIAAVMGAYAYLSNHPLPIPIFYTY